MFRQLIVKYAKVLSTECFVDCCDYRRLSVAGYSHVLPGIACFLTGLEMALFPLGKPADYSRVFRH